MNLFLLPVLIVVVVGVFFFFSFLFFFIYLFILFFFLPPSQSKFHGCVAVGTTDSHVYLVDVRLHDLPVVSPVPLYDLQPAQEPYHGNYHGCVALNDAFHRSGRFDYVYGEPRPNLSERFEEDGSTYVTAMEFFPDICSLVVGYNFAAFHFWCLSGVPTLV